MLREVNFELIDRRSLRRRVGGDMDLLREMISIFSADYPVLLEELQQAIDRGDCSAVEKASHKLKGSLVQFSAGAAAETARRLEEMGKRASVADAPAALETLKRELEELILALSAVASDGFTA